MTGPRPHSMQTAACIHSLNHNSIRLQVIIFYVSVYVAECLELSGLNK